MPLEHYEVRFKNLDGKMIRRQITHIDGYEDGTGPGLDLSRVGDERISSFDEIPYFYEIAPYLRNFSIGSPINEKINLSIFKKLKSLNLCISATEIKGLESLSLLENLGLSYTRFKRINGLDELKNLQSLGLTNANLDKIPVLGDLNKLKRLDLSKNRISKIEGLDSLENLENLNLSNNQISKIEGLNGLKNLYGLNFQHNQISQIQGLDGLSNLHQIFLSFNPISKIGNLSGLNKLRTVFLSDTKIKSIAGIESLPVVDSLNITNTNVSSLAPLLKCPQIHSIRAENCPIRSLYGIPKDPDHIREFLVNPTKLRELTSSPENLSELSVSTVDLCPTGARLYRTAVSRRTSTRNFDIHEIPALLDFYKRSVTNLALQYAKKDKSQPLTPHEVERLIHEAAQKERTILENAVDKNFLSQNDSILSEITARFSVNISKNIDLKILL